MPQRLIICAAESRSQANRILGHLLNGGFTQDAVSISFVDINGPANAGARKRSAASSLAAKAGVGALLGGAFVWLSGMGNLSVPGLGSLIIAGSPLVAAMGRLRRGGMTRVLGNLGLPKCEAAFYEAKVRQGNILISVSVSDGVEATAAKHIIRAIGLQDIVDTGAETVSPTSATPESIEKTMLESTAGYC
jgi:hypothetical protein